MLVFFPQEMDG